MRLNETKQKERARKLAYLAEYDITDCASAFVTNTPEPVTLVVIMFNNTKSTPQGLIDFCVDHNARLQVVHEDVMLVRYHLYPNKGGFKA